MDLGHDTAGAFRAEVLSLFLYVAMGVSLVIVPVYFAIGIDALTYACAAYCGATTLMCYLRNWRGHQHPAYAQVFLGSTLLVMLAGLYLGSANVDNKPWQMVFPLVAFLVAGSRLGTWWVALAWAGSAAVFALRWPIYGGLSIMVFLLAHASMSWALYVFTRRNEFNIRTISRLSHTDALTSTYNRQLFDELLGKVFNRARRTHEALAVYMIDIDHFKQYNDNYGHLAGDRALARVAAVIRRSARRASDLVFRYGGEEFCVLSAGVSEADARGIAEHIVEGVRALAIAHHAFGGGRLTVSIGLSYQERVDGHDAERLLGHADRALYLAKARGRDRVEQHCHARAPDRRCDSAA